MPKPPRRPQQQRSQATLNRLLDTCEQLLKKNTFSDITIADITEGASSSVGAFYKRFSSKADLLPYLLERLQDRQLASIKTFVDDPKWQGVPLADRITVFIGTLAKSYKDRRGLIRALVTRQFSDRSELPASEIQKARAIVDLIANWLLQCKREIQHDAPEDAVRVGMFIAVTSLQVGILYRPSTKRFSDATLIQETEKVLLAYLGIAETRTTARTTK